jgi:hypothetical protein
VQLTYIITQLIVLLLRHSCLATSSSQKGCLQNVTVLCTESDVCRLSQSHSTVAQEVAIVDSSAAVSSNGRPTASKSSNAKDKKDDQKLPSSGTDPCLGTETEMKIGLDQKSTDKNENKSGRESKTCQEGQRNDDPRVDKNEKKSGTCVIV